jgi:hypothetical protein
MSLLYRVAKFWLSAFFLTLTALSKIEIFFAAGMLHLVFVIAYWRLGRLSARMHLAGYGAALAYVLLMVVMIILMFFFRRMREIYE